MKTTHQIGGPSPFPLIHNFLEYAINRHLASASAQSIKPTKEAKAK